MYVKPKTGFQIRDCDLLDLLPEEGRDVPDTEYWQRRINDGDVELAPAPAAAPAAPATASAAD